MQTLKIDPKFEPSAPRSGDELYPNGIFEFNITRLLAYIATEPSDVAIAEVDVSGLARYSSSLDEAYIASADLSQPVILAEIAPNQYNLIDGHHRLEKARRLGLQTIRAYRLTAPQHIPFLTTTRAYLSYIDYWNGKVAERLEGAG